MSVTTTDPQAAWVLAGRDEERDRWHEHYATRFPPPPADCSIHHGAFGAGCPWCSTPTSRAAARTPIAADRCATTTQEGTS